MRNKGFFWFLTILLTVICIYQLSFTWVSTGIESDVAKASQDKVEALFAEAKEQGEDTLFLPNSTKVNVNDPESFEIAVAAYINDSLKQLAECQFRKA